ncbi:hypothetical protein GM658_24925 [Pseudoduganella eburnea]|uniref:DUF3300 domain-containing protein n=1 Tax=Massilia eburnea TaxID=1776165 RepID=A0A6L6QP11_9BURK|nr:hypothetical protein [Massilia eburnea]MTW13861.1 hypothetical protein [Massilia eburnea]
MRKLVTSIALAAFACVPALGNASVNISIDVVQYPVLQRVPGYPVYYAPHLHANYFFYDGLYWVYADGVWYSSPWYDGPWDLVAVDSVPLFVLRVPVRYYVAPPPMFTSWVMSAPPRWDSVWGPGWAHRHRNWQRWNRAAVPAPAPLPVYQQRFTRANYPNEVQRRELVQQHYRYAPHDPQTRQRWPAQVAAGANRPAERTAPAHQSQPQSARPTEPRYGDRRQMDRAEAPPFQHAPSREARPAPHERPPMRTDAPRNEAFMNPGHAEQREAARNARPEHGGRPDKADRPEKDEGHEPGRRH